MGKRLWERENAELMKRAEYENPTVVSSITKDLVSLSRI